MKILFVENYKKILKSEQKSQRKREFNEYILK